MPLADDVDLDRLASGTVGLTGADIRNLVNEAALWATRNGKDKVDMDDFEHARDHVLMGPKREEVLSGKEKRMTAYHESGHALLAWIVPGADRVHKVTIIPRGRSLGVTQLLPEEDRLNISESGAARPAVLHARRPRGRKADLRRVQRRRRERPDAGHATGPPHGHRLGHERAARPGRLSHQRGASVPGQGDLRAARVQRAHGAADRRGSRPHPARRRRSGQQAAQRASRANWKSWPTALEEHEVLDEHEIEQLLGPSINKRAAESNGRAVDVAPDGGKGGDIKPSPWAGRRANSHPHFADTTVSQNLGDAACRSGIAARGRGELPWLASRCPLPMRIGPENGARRWHRDASFTLFADVALPGDVTGAAVTVLRQTRDANSNLLVKPMLTGRSSA